MSIQVVWLKRDLRLSDHRPLARAAAAGPVLPLYIYEPSLLASETFDPSHLIFVNEGLAELDATLRERSGRLTLRVGELPEVLDRLREELAPTGGFGALWSHEETGDDLTYRRDRRVAAWCRDHGVAWTEIPQHGVTRPLENRDGWSRRWQARMREPLTPVPERIGAPVLPPDFDHGRIRSPEELGLPVSGKSEVQIGGEIQARRVLHTFLHERGKNYRADMSSPVTGWEGCSRISPYLAWGNIGMREIHQTLEERRAELKSLPATKRGPLWLPSLSSFAGRLRWHCHFMQKLEDEPCLEFENMNRAYDGLREDEFDQERFAAWCEGRTGYPMVDAVIHCLHATGWVNFRMRAMLVSFASHHLWLHWRPTALYLARHFLDYEPGIHFSQFQMQSGVTGINTVRIYNPIKQARDQDPDGIFVRRWVPELREVPPRKLPEPWTMSRAEQEKAGCVIGKNYPGPLVEHATAYAAARRRIHAVKRSETARAESRRVYARHGSRRRPGLRRPR